MGIKKYILATVAAISLYISPVLASTVTTVGSAATYIGPLGLQIDLGISMIPGLTAAQVRYYYNIISFGLVIWIAFAADERKSTEFCIIATAMAALCAWAGWFTTPSDTGKWGLITLCALLSVAMYITEKKRITYGVGGGGDPMLNILLFLLIFQATVGLVNGAGIFPIGTGAPQESVCANAQYSACAINGNVQLMNAGENTGTNGLQAPGTDIVTMIATAGWGLLMLVVQLAVSIFVFSYVVVTVYPWIGNSPQAMILLGMLQIGIWFVYTLTIYRWIWKPMPGDAKV